MALSLGSALRGRTYVQLGRGMEICNDHNYVNHGRDPDGRHGIRVSLPAGDCFAQLVDTDWETWHWFNNPRARDAAMADMARRHEYSRAGDEPRIVLEAVDR